MLQDTLSTMNKIWQFLYNQFIQSTGRRVIYRLSLLCFLKSLEKKMIPIPLLVFHLVQAVDTAKDFVYLITK